MIFGILKPYPSPLISGRGIDLDFPCWPVAWRCWAWAW